MLQSVSVLCAVNNNLLFLRSAAIEGRGCVKCMSTEGGELLAPTLLNECLIQ